MWRFTRFCGTHAKILAAVQLHPFSFKAQVRFAQFTGLAAGVTSTENDLEGAGASGAASSSSATFPTNSAADGATTSDNPNGAWQSAMAPLFRASGSSGSGLEQQPQLAENQYDSIISSSLKRFIESSSFQAAVEQAVKKCRTSPASPHPIVAHDDRQRVDLQRAHEDLQRADLADGEVLHDGDGKSVSGDIKFKHGTFRLPVETVAGVRVFFDHFPTRALEVIGARAAIAQVAGDSSRAEAYSSLYEVLLKQLQKSGNLGNGLRQQPNSFARLVIHLIEQDVDATNVGEAYIDPASGGSISKLEATVGPIPVKLDPLTSLPLEAPKVLVERVGLFFNASLAAYVTSEAHAMVLQRHWVGRGAVPEIKPSQVFFPEAAYITSTPLLLALLDPAAPYWAVANAPAATFGAAQRQWLTNFAKETRVAIAAAQEAVTEQRRDIVAQDTEYPSRVVARFYAAFVGRQGAPLGPQMCAMMEMMAAPNHGLTTEQSKGSSGGAGGARGGQLTNSGAANGQAPRPKYDHMKWGPDVRKLWEKVFNGRDGAVLANLEGWWRKWNAFRKGALPVLPCARCLRKYGDRLGRRGKALEPNDVSTHHLGDFAHHEARCRG
jgi:hypothetical protein